MKLKAWNWLKDCVRAYVLSEGQAISDSALLCNAESTH